MKFRLIEEMHLANSGKYNLSAFKPVIQAAVEYAKKDGVFQIHFIDGASWQGDQIMSHLRFIIDALPIEASIPDPKLRSEIELVRNKINEIIAKIQ